MDAHSEALRVGAADERHPSLEAIFTAHYRRISHVLARVVHDPARAEELAVEVFLKWSLHVGAHGEQAAGWLYRTAVRMGLDELRRQSRRARSERLLTALRPSPATPEDVRAANEDQRRVRTVLATLRARQAELLVLRSQGFHYEELGALLGLNPASVGTLLGRAAQAFRKEYVNRYGRQ